MIFVGAPGAPNSLPVTLSNGTVANADQVMQLFNDINNFMNAATSAIPTSTGSANAQNITTTATTVSLHIGDAFLFVVGSGLTNTGPTTLDRNGGGAVAITASGSPLTGGELAEGAVAFVVYDGVNFQLLSGGASGSRGASNNVLINPSMEIDQENEGDTVLLVNATTQYIVDGWVTNYAGAISGATSGRVVDGPAGFTNSLLFLNGTGAAVGAGDFLKMVQFIEANNITDWQMGTATAQQLWLSFWIKSSIAPYVGCGSLRNAAFDRSYCFNFNITNAGAWEKKIIAIPGDTTGTWVTTGAGIGARVAITAAAGSAYHGAPNVWSAGNFFGTASCTNTIMSTNGATFQVTGVQLEAGPSPSSFVRRPFGEELALCQRYYEKSYDPGVKLGDASVPDGFSFVYSVGPVAITAGTSVEFKVSKRVNSTITMYSQFDGIAGKVFDASNNVNVNPGIVSVGQESFSWAAIFSANSTNLQAHWVADARL